MEVWYEVDGAQHYFVESRGLTPCQHYRALCNAVEADAPFDGSVSTTPRCSVCERHLQSRERAKRAGLSVL